MKTNMKLVLLYVVTVIGLLSLTACGDSPEAARKKLASMGMDYSVDQFVFAANKGDMVAVKAFIDAGMAIDTPIQIEDSTETALSAACSGGQLETVKYLLAHGANVNAIKDGGVTPLMWAVQKDQKDIVEALLAKQPDLEATINGRTALDKAGVYVCLELLERLDNLAVILFAAEEIGGLGSKNAPASWFTDVGYMIEFDCPGQGLVSYTSGGIRLFANDGEFIQHAAPVMDKHKLTQWQYHPFSDVMVVRQRFPISCLNLSCGYYNWHQADECIVLAEVSAAIRSGHALIKALGCKRYDFPVGGMDNVPPRFEVTSLKVPPPVSRAVKPVKPLPMALKPTATELAPTIMPGLDTDESMLDYVIPDDVSFFKLALLDRLKSRAYHTFSLLGPFKMPQLCEAFREHIFRSDTLRAENGHKLVTRLLFTFADNVYGYLEDDRLKVYGPSPEVALATAERFTGFIKPKAEEKPYFCIMSLEDTGPSAQKVTIHRPAPVTTEDLALNYGADFPAWEDGWLQRMNKSASGLSILLGPPGCGKTSYLRALMTRLLNKAIFYFVPVNSMDLLTSPRYVNFWVKQTERHSKMRKIAILEDAEELLLPREGHTRDRVSNLLNIADGFLGDHLKLHVLATTNVAMDQLDPAIIRPGRLTGSREFRRLQRPEALRLAEAKGLCLPEGQPDYSLAEIYCGRPASTLGDCKRQIGFAS